MFAAGMLGAVFGAGGTLAYFEYTGKAGLRAPRAAPTPTAVVKSQAAAAPRSDPNSPGDPSAIVGGDPSTTRAYRQMSKWGFPSDDTVFVKEGFASSFDTARRIPRWVLEVVTLEGIESKAVKRDASKFYSNDKVPEPFRAANADYAGYHGLSRGHLAPASFHRDSQSAMDATFDLSLNVVPQDMAQNATDWLRVEKLTKNLAKEFERLYVVTGPLFVPVDDSTSAMTGRRISPNDRPRRVVKYDVIGTHDVAVPTHMFKSILAERKDGSTATASFVVPNAPIPEAKPLSAYQVPKEHVERWSGLQLFPHAGTRVGNLCAAVKCDAAGGGFETSFRRIAKLRAAPTRAALEQAWMGIQGEGGKVDSALEKEYKMQLSSFTATR